MIEQMFQLLPNKWKTSIVGCLGSISRFFCSPSFIGVETHSCIAFGYPALASPGICKSWLHFPPEFFVVMKRSHRTEEKHRIENGTGSV